VRLHVAIETSTDENTRLMVSGDAAQLRGGDRVDIRSFEFADFFLRCNARGRFRCMRLRGIGGNEDPDILCVFVRLSDEWDQ